MWLLEPFVWVGLIFLAVQAHGLLERRRSLPETERKTLSQALRTMLPQEKAEFLPPMTDEEYEEHLDKESGRAGLVNALKEKLPWNSKPPKSPSSDSS